MNSKFRLGTVLFSFALIVGFATVIIESLAEYLKQKNVNTN
ncbi:hypothetical protein [Flavobacterium sp.]